MKGIRFISDFSTQLFVIIPTVSLEDFGGGLHVVFRFGPFSYTIMRDESISKVREEFLSRMRDLENECKQKGGENE